MFADGEAEVIVLGLIFPELKVFIGIHFEPIDEFGATRCIRLTLLNIVFILCFRFLRI